MKFNYLLIMPRVAVKIGVKYSFPIGIAYISSAMKQAGFNIRTLNPNHTEESMDNILAREILGNNINVVLTGGLSGQYNSVKNVVDYAKMIKPDITTIVGGGLISAEPDIAMKALGNADFGVIGEGEITIVELCNALENNLALDGISGIIYRNFGGKLKLNKARSEINNIDDLLFPDYDGFDIKSYLKLPSETFFGASGGKTFFCLSARSCPYQCTFCFHTLGRKYRTRSIENVLDEIKLLHDKYDIQQIVLEDELFAQNKERVRIFSERMRYMNISWVGTFRIDQVDEELLEIIKKSTCKQMFFGLESVNNHILKSMRKNLTLEVIEKNLKMVYNAKIPFGGNLLFGDMEDTLETCRNNLAWYKAHPEYNVSLVNIVTYPGTTLYKYAVKEGKIKDKIQFLKDGCPIINISKMTDPEYAILQQEMLGLAAGFSLNNQKLLAFPPETKHAAISGNCRRCNAEVSVNDVLFLTTDYSYIYCPKCGAKHRSDLPKELQEILFDNMRILIEQKQTIAIWGIQPYTWDIFNNSAIFANESITFIDNNQGKQFLKITRRKKPVLSPQILQTEQFECVIFCYPHLYLNYADLVKNQYPKVKKFIDILDLMYFSH
jgi:radical SAM superfamily enzyme YgiQ (UPF0313 family)